VNFSSPLCVWQGEKFVNSVSMLCFQQPAVRFLLCVDTSLALGMTRQISITKFKVLLEFLWQNLLFFDYDLPRRFYGNGFTKTTYHAFFSNLLAKRHKA